MISLGRAGLRISTGPIFLLVLLHAAVATAMTGAPVPPCAGTPVPYFSGFGAPPSAEVWHQDELPAAWRPPDCLGKFADAPALIVSVAARFRGTSDATVILSRFGAISQLTHVRYWSVTDHSWENLVTRASALTAPEPKAIRADFTAAEVASGQPLYFLQRDNRSSGPVIYRMVGRSQKADSFVIEIENVTPVKFYLLQIFPIGGLRVRYFLERAGADGWTYYSLTAVDKGASSIALDGDRSFINRAVASYRHIAGIPTDQEPPPAP